MRSQKVPFPVIHTAGVAGSNPAPPTSKINDLRRFRAPSSLPVLEVPERACRSSLKSLSGSRVELCPCRSMRDVAPGKSHRPAAMGLRLLAGIASTSRPPENSPVFWTATPAAPFDLLSLRCEVNLTGSVERLLHQTLDLTLSARSGPSAPPIEHSFQTGSGRSPPVAELLLTARSESFPNSGEAGLNACSDDELRMCVMSESLSILRKSQNHRPARPMI